MAMSSSSKFLQVVAICACLAFMVFCQALTMVLPKVRNCNQSDVIHDLPTAECSQRTVHWLSGRAASWLLFKLSILIPIQNLQRWVGYHSVWANRKMQVHGFYIQSLSTRSLVFVLVLELGCFVQTESRKVEYVTDCRSMENANYLDNQMILQEFGNMILERLLNTRMQRSCCMFLKMFRMESLML